MRTKGLVIVFPWVHWDSHPTMHALACELRRTWDRILLVWPSGLARLRADGTAEPVRAGTLPAPLAAAAALAWQRLPATGWRGRAVRLAAALTAPWAHRHCDAVLGVDPMGLVFAAELSRGWRRPLAYASFEILFGDELSAPWEEALKRAERAASDMVELALVQDLLRGGLLARENGIPPDRHVHVPVAPLPAGVPASDYLRRVLGLPPDRRIVLLAGSIESFSSRDLLGAIADVMPDDHELVVHVRDQGAPRRRVFLDRLELHPRISVSREFLPLERLPELYASADVALVSYSPNPEGWTTMQNVFNIGAASGKAAYAAMCGLPLLTSDLPTYREVFASYDCGRVFRTLGDIPGILRDLASNRARLAAEARRYYAERLDPRRGLSEFRARLERAAGLP